MNPLHAARFLAAVVLCGAALTGCGDGGTTDDGATGSTGPTVAGLAERDEPAVRASLATLDACGLLEVAGIEATSATPRTCFSRGADRVEVQVGVPLDGRGDELVEIAAVAAVREDGDPCRILLPASRVSAVEVMAGDCSLAEEVATAVVEAVTSGEAPRTTGVAAHDACALLGTALEVGAADLEAPGIDVCTAASAPSDDSTSPTTGLELPDKAASLRLTRLAQSPERVADLAPGSTLTRIAGLPAVVEASAGTCRVQLMVGDPADEGAFATQRDWADLRSATQDCDALRPAVERLAEAVAEEPAAEVGALFYAWQA